ncbi:hypothetical protein GJ744_011271 [Endocarpon pusillum]|uniref:Fucose-specific lectin n=1 Tax=Endocarpon pusillum TaxID=364733 RepID=A0A8H7AXN0_9EURO|nr:hypothetical protein GJ744_011271 [Endocarpon pusillum]
MDRTTRSIESMSSQLSGAQTQLPTEWQDFYNTSQQAPRQVSPPQETYREVGVSQQGSLTEGTEPPSSATTTQPPVIGSPGLESVVSTEDKEVVNGPGQPPVIGFPGLESVVSPKNKEVHNGTGDPSASPPAYAPRKRICGLPKKWFLVAASLATCIIVALAIALGVVFGTRGSSSNDTTLPQPTATDPPPDTGDPDFYVGGALNPQYYSTAGAFNGTGLALAEQSFGQGNRGNITLYYQHWSGHLRWSQLSNGEWQGGSAEIVAHDAKNGTPISAVSYAMDERSIWHIFYVNEDNMLREKVNSNTTNIWIDGPLSRQNLTVNRADRIGMQACWFGNYYGDSSFNAFNATNTEVGMRLWYATSNTTFDQLGWLYGEDDWVYQNTWHDKNGQAGVGCYSWGNGSDTYVFMVNLDNTLEIWWMDTNTSLAETSSHPINKWTNTSISIPNLHPSASLGYTDYLYAQSADYTIHGYRISWHSENTSFVPGDNFTILSAGNGALGIPGTHLSVTSLNGTSGGRYLYAFYQTEGNDISIFSRDVLAGLWAEDHVPIEND